MIFADASRYNNTAQRTGVENYSVNLINALVKLAPREIILVSPRKIPLDIPQRIIPFPRLWTQVRLSLEVCKNASLRSSTFFIPSHQMPVIHPKNTVITIHDVAFKRFSDCYSWASRMYLEWGAKFAVKHARKIIVPSQVTKDDLIEFYKASPQKIAVIPHGHTPLSNVIPSTPFVIPTNAEGSLDYARDDKGSARDDKRPYFLFIGRIERKKNLLTLIQAFGQFYQTHPDFKLVLAGKSGVGGNEIVVAAKKNPAIVLTGYVDEPTKVALLKNAFAFVFPSLYEGFGIPLLEAMQFNLPIIASDIPASREIAKKAALFFKPSEPNELAELMGKLAEDDDLRAALVKNFPDLLAHYSWDRCAEQTLKVLKNEI